MGLFDVFKKKDKENEFESDIKALMARNDIECRQDICEAEYQKALQLANSDNQKNIHRAYDLMGNLASQFDYPPASLWMGDFMENAVGNLEQSVYWYKKAADAGDANGARCYADMLMIGKGAQQNIQEAFKYYSIAAENGIPEAAFVMGEILRNAGEKQKALAAYQKALDNGYMPAKKRIAQLQQ